MPQLVVLALLVLSVLVPQQSEPVAPSRPFVEWLTEVEAEARGRGFSEQLIREALGGLTPLQQVVRQDRTQAEVTLTFDRYFGTRVTPPVIRRGRELGRQHRTLLARIEREYGVPRQVLLAIWGIESRYGQAFGRTPVFQALATLAWDQRRSAYFRSELFNALTMVANGHIDVASMTGSWAGAMGQPQFMPSSYLAYAVDFDGDGRRDIWRSVPDTLASIANYLRGYGWEPGLTWGREVRIAPEAREAIAVPLRAEGCTARRTISEYRTLDEWREMGVRRADGSPLPNAFVYGALADLADRTFLLYPNYDVILGYNCAHLYALSVAMLSDRLR